MDEGLGGGAGGRGVWAEHVANKGENEETHIPVTFATTDIRSLHPYCGIMWTLCTLNMPLMQNYQHYINQKRSLMPTQHHLHV